jgi:hypothetical protein
MSVCCSSFEYAERYGRQADDISCGARQAGPRKTAMIERAKPARPLFDGNGSIPMSEQVLVMIGNRDVRFTPDGRVAVLDAINALSDLEPAEHIWEEFKRENPDIECNVYTFPGEETLCVIDRKTMQRVEDWLFA